MNYREQLKKALARAQELAKAAAERDLTEEELTETKNLGNEIEDLRGKVKAHDEASMLLTSLGSSAQVDDTPEERKSDAGTGGLGDRFVNSEGYKAWAKAHPSGVGQGTPIDIKGGRVGSLADLGRKADPAPLALPDAHVAPVRYPTIDLTYPPTLQLLELITRGQTSGAFEYLQILDVTSNAGIVAESATATGTDGAGGLKPLSDMTTDLADAKVYTYADGYTVTNQMLADAPAMASFLNGRMSYNLNSEIVDVLINGAGTGGVPAGILHTTGVQSQGPVDADGADVATGAGDIFATTRKGITKVTQKGGTVSAVLLSVEDDEMWDLKRNSQGTFYSQGPFASGPNTAWGRPRIALPQLPAGTFILGDLKTVALLDREGLSVLAFNQHADYARRNLTYVRAELRAAQAIFEPALLVVGSLTAAGG